MNQQHTVMRLEDLSAAGLVLLPFLAIFVLLSFIVPFQSEQMEAADSIVQAFHAWTGIKAILILSIIVCGVLLWIRVPSKSALRRALRLAALGCIAALVFVVFLRRVFGKSLPAFIPPEESARPGLLFGLGAGISEEVIFRLMILPVTYTLASRVAKPQMAMAIAILVTGVLFALAHEVGPGAEQFYWEHFITRFVSAGSLMSVLFFWPGPAFVISMHCTAHIILPFLFTG